MSIAGGVHPYTLRRRNALLREKPKETGILQASAMVLLALSVFAFGLRWIDQRLAPPLQSGGSRPVRESQPPFSDGLSSGLRFILGIPTAYAADYVTYSGYRVGPAPVVTAAPGETKTIDLTFKNTGRVTWSHSGRAFVSAYTIKPRYHASLFYSPDWTSSSQTPHILETSVPPGKTGTIRLTLTAPKTAGTYTDTIQLAAEDTSWMWGAWTPITLKVSGAPVAVSANPAPAPASAPAPVSAPVTAVATDDAPPPPAASLVYRSADRIEAPGGLQMTMRVTDRKSVV